MTEAQALQVIDLADNQNTILTAIDYKLQVLISVILVFVIVMICRYVYKFFNMFFQ